MNTFLNKISQSYNAQTNQSFFRKYLFGHNTLKKLPGWRVWCDLMPELNWLYGRLRDQNSKSVLENIILFRLTGGHWKNPWRGGKQRWLPPVIEEGANTEIIQTSFMGWHLVKRSMKELGFPITIFLPPFRPIVTFDLEQYSDHNNKIYVKEGDIVIDGGGCWGDTALYFASLGDTDCKVYTFEFMAENLEIMKRNLSLNPDFKGRIKVIEKALWSTSGQELNFICDGPGTRLDSINKNTSKSLTATTITIDDFVASEGIPRVDFIKLDIEGAELEALKGAEKTIKKHRPVLALCVYHKPEHFTELARFIDTLECGYLYSLDHLSDCEWETVLYASPY
jgi:FkbM family methyltransferase